MLQGQGQRTSSNHKKGTRNREGTKKPREVGAKPGIWALAAGAVRTIALPHSAQPKFFCGKSQRSGDPVPSVPRGDVSRAGWVQLAGARH